MLDQLIYGVVIGLAAICCLYNAAFREHCDKYSCPDAMAYAKQEGFKSKDSIEYLMGLEESYKLKRGY